ncbi:hypothetical protein GCM10010472_01950 [Pseudonocardia halophobica]|uniref:FAS1-like dehydratase domain-containing protein n=1 Tax=Pseudonocardia halophobica TaxID=29401 RepID=A0A9W6L1L9_9PSEU|nr:MaoC family dehydratase N-terminal domain-containing protein [Pseudonocardia halophobica]GLL10535.1 hypothetical protein GCM10017577_16750 [Pseudonocardia halophobica]
MSTTDEFTARLQAFVGKGEGPTTSGVVDPTVITRLTEALGDRNPVYSDPSAAEKSPHGEIVAPVTALMSWTVAAKPLGVFGVDEAGREHFRLEAAPNGSASARAADPNGVDWGSSFELREFLKAEGFVAPAVTNGWFEYERYLRPGERVVVGPFTIDEIVGPKRTGLGEGYFITQSQRVTDAEGELVAVIRQRILRAKPVAAAAATEEKAPSVPTAGGTAGAEEAPAPTVEWSTERRPGPEPGAVSVGDTLPALVVELTPTVIVAGAIASQDWAPVHHDTGFARKMGHPDVFMNIQMSTGFVGRLITDWAGPGALIEALDIRLGVPNYAYDTMTMTGEVTAVEQVGERVRLTVPVVARNSRGVHISSTVTLTVPA